MRVIDNGKKVALAIMATLVLLACPAAAHQDGSAPNGSFKVEPTPDLIAQGKEIFVLRCAGCHRAYSTQGRKGPGLKGLYAHELSPVLKHPVTDAYMRDHIHQGSQHMPGFPDIKGPDMRALIAFLKSL